MTKKNCRSIILPASRNVPDKVELGTAYLLQRWPGLKTDIEFLAAGLVSRMKNPDIAMNGLRWEIKNPKGRGKYVISRNLYTASKQSENIVLDMRHMPGSYKHYLAEIKREFMNNPRAKRLLLLTKAQTIIDLVK